MRKSFLIIAVLIISINLKAQKEQDWANFGRYEEANKQVMSLAPNQRQVVFLGNSITEGWYNQDSAFFINNKFINRGIGGQTTSQMLIRFRRDVIDLHPKLVIILAGTNDIAQNTGYISIENILGNFQTMAEIAKANKIKMIICSVLPAFDYPWRPGMEPNVKIPQLNELLKEYANKNHIEYVDYFTAMKDARNGLPANLSKDGVHPNLDGDKVMESIILKSIHKALHNK